MTRLIILYTVPSRKRAHYEISAHPHFRLNFLGNMRPCVAALENAAQWLVYEDLTSKIYIRPISNMLNS